MFFFSGTLVPLRSVFEVAAANAREYVAPAANVAAPQKSEEEKEIDLVPEALREKFRGYLEKLKGTIYFKDIEPNTPAWFKRVAKAREKFMRKYGGSDAPATKSYAEAAGGGGASSPVSTPSSAAAPRVISPADEARADQLKNEGNEFLKRGDYASAERLYTEAIALRPNVAVYFSNRAAARQYQNRHEDALADAKESVRLDPTFVKGFMRIGQSSLALGRVNDALREGFARALILSPDDESIKQAVRDAEQRLAQEQPNNGAPPPMGGGLEGLLNNPAMRGLAEQVGQRGFGGPNGGGIDAFLRDPNMMNMAMNALQDPEMQRMLQSPMFQGLAQQAAQNPDMLRNMMGAFGGMGGGGGAGGGFPPQQQPPNNNEDEEENK